LAPFLFPDLIESDFGTRDQVTSIQSPVLDLDIDSQGIVPEYRVPPERLHRILDTSFDGLCCDIVADSWESSVERCEKWRLFPFKFGILPVSFDKKPNKNVVMVWVLDHPYSVPHDRVVYDWIDDPINGIK
jgi:hypothetical protein